MNYLKLFEEAVEKYRDKTAFVDQDATREMTYGELDTLSGRVASKLIAQGLNRQEAVIIRMGRKSEYIASTLGILKAGGVATPVLEEYPMERVEFIRKDCEAKRIIEDDFFEDIDNYEPVKGVILEDDALASLVYTSGSTGNPKGIEHTIESYCAGITRSKILYEGLDPIEMAAVASMSFIVTVLEYFTVLLLGGRVHVISDAVRKDVRALEEYYVKQKITVGFISPQMLRLFDCNSPHLKRVIAGSERLANAYSENFDIYFGYGMSETCAQATLFIVDKKYGNTPIGKTTDDLEPFILDENGQCVKDGEAGELCLAGPVARGYRNLPEQTKKTFQRLPDGRTLLHTGDIVKKDADGNMIYLNRKDWMVKINGQRVETQEIEAIISDMDEVTNAAVKGFEDNNGQTYLVAYYVEKTDVSVEKIKAALKGKMPDYMIPRFFKKLEAMPINANGKLNRNLLLPPDVNDFKEEYVAPSDEVEQAICEGFEAVLNCGKVGVYDDYIRLGGDSIKVLKLAVQLSRYNVNKDMILRGRTPREIAQLSRGEQRDVIPHLTKFKESYQFTDAQMGVYLDCIKRPDTKMYNIPAMLKLPEETDQEKFIQAVKTVIRTHRAFHVVVKPTEEGPVMVIREREPEIIRKQAENIEKEKNSFVQPFDLEQGPLYRAELCEVRGATYFLFDAHHLIFDGISLTIFMEDIGKVYCGNQLAKEQLTLFDVSVYEEDLRDTRYYQDALAFFEEKLEGMEADLSLYPDYNTQNPSGSSKSIEISVSEWFSGAEIEQYVKTTEITENTLFLGAFAYTMAKAINQKECYFTTASNGRYDERMVSSTGMFVKTLPMHCIFDENMKVRDFLQELQNDFFKILDYDCVSFGELAEKYHLTLGSTFVYQAEMLDGPVLDNGKVYAEYLHTGETQSDLSVMVVKVQGNYNIILRYRDELFSRETIRNFMETFLTVVRGFLDTDRLCSVPLIASDVEAKLDSFNRTRVTYEPIGVVEQFRRQVSLVPENPAVAYLDRTYTYAQVDELTERIAGYLKARGIGREDVVSVLIPRCEYMVIASLGVLKAGAAYQPLDPSYPKDRIRFMMQDADAKLLIAEESLMNMAEGYGGEVLLTKDIPSLPACDKVEENPNPEDLFVLLYTSGSTGVPKGVMLEHRNVAALCHWYHGAYKLTSEDNVALYPSYGFDAHMMDLYPAITGGACVHIIDESIRLDLMALNDYFEKNNIVHVTMTTQVGRQFVAEMENHSLRALSVGGEKLVPVEPPKHFEFYNEYGPTECTILTSRYLVDKLYDKVPVGKPVDNLKVYVVDKEGRRLPPGMLGELWIAGHQVGRGYLNQPEQSKKVFIHNPFSKQEGYERVYCTGDIVRLLPDGTIDFVGRDDGMVKIRGFRIELSEVECVIREFPGIKDATVADFDAAGGGKFLAAYVVSNNTIDVDALNDFIAERKPSYMVPEVTMQIEQIPLTQNQKVDKKALPVPQKKAKEIIAPKNEVQQRIFDCIAEVIGSKEFGITTDIYEAGITSIGSLRLNVLLSKAFDVVIRNQDLKENNTVEKLEQFVAVAGQAEVYEVYPDYPLTQTQNGIFVESQANPGTTIYNIPSLLRLGSGVDVEKLKTAVEKTIDAHPYVKMRLFYSEDGEVRAARDDSRKPEVNMISLDRIPGNEELVRPYELIDSSLYRAEIYKTGEGNFLFLDFHHIICDGVSNGILIDDINRFYAGENVERESYTGYEAALEERKLRQGEAYDKAKKYYDSVFQGCETDFLPVKDQELPTPAVSQFEWESGLTIDVVEKFCTDHDLTVNAFFNGVFGFVLSRYNDREEAVYTTVYNGRNDSRLSHSVTMLVKTLPVLCKTRGERKIEELLTATRDQLVESMANDIYSFAEIAKAYDIKADILFVYQGDSFAFDVIAGEKVEACELKLDTAKAPITIFVYIKDNKIIFRCEYRSDMYQQDNMKGMINCLEIAAEEFLTKTYLKEVSLLTKETETLLDSFNQTQVSYEPVSVVEQFRKQVALVPENPAVVYLDKSYTYAQVDEITERIAGYLKAKGIGAEDVVSILIPRCEYMVIASLGVLKAGAAYQPLDPSYPKERIGFMMQDAAAKHLIAEESLLRLAEGYEGEVLLTRDIPSLPVCEKINEISKPEDLFILLYTSGSTGVPKGVMLEHHNLTAFCNWYRRFYELTPESKVAAYASYGFDADMMDLYPALTTGACVYIVDEGIRLDLIALNDYFENNGITHSFMTTQVGRQFAEEFGTCSLKALSVGGETLVPLDAPEKFGFYNGYGPTECTVFSTIYGVEQLSWRVPIGKPLDNVRLYVVDKEGRRVPPGIPGELWIAGHQVGRGYLNQPEESGKVFIQNPFSQEKGYERVYRTGDIVRLLPDGNIDFIGRNDGQVKIRGFRIELSEVERVIRQFPGIKDATVADFDAAGGGKFLAAYVISDDAIEVEKLNDFIAEQKPPYMVPEVIMQIDRIPLNQNQKVDKKALPVPERKVEEMLSPQNDTQQKIFDCMAEVIGTREFGITTDIYEAGVTSIGAIRLNVLLSKAFDVVIRNQDLKENNTIEKIEKFIAGAGKAEAYEVYADYPLTQTQSGIFVESVANEGTTIYNIPFLFRLGGSVNVEKLKAAVERTIDAHPYVKTTLFLNDRGDVRAARNDDEKPVVEMITCEKIPSNEELVLPYEMLGGRLYQAKIYQTDEGNYLFLDFHHIICDGTSEGIIIRDMNRAYEGEKLKTESYSGFEIALDEEKLRKTDAYEKAKKYYDTIFNGCDMDFLLPADRSGRKSSVGQYIRMSGLKADTLKEFCAANKVTLNAFFNSVFGFVLAKYKYKNEAVYTTIYNGRNDARLSDSVVMLVKTLPVYCNTDGERKITDYMSAVQEQLVNSMANDLYSFPEIAREYNLKADIMFVYQGDEFEFGEVCGEKADSIPLVLNAAKSMISINVVIKENQVGFVFDYRSDLYEEETMQGMSECLVQTIREFMKKNYLKEISMVSQESEEILKGFNATEVDIEPTTCNKLFEEQAALHPDKTAVIANKESITYEELNKNANRIAHYLMKAGVKPDDMVGVMVPRYIHTYAARQGVLKAGGAFLPIDHKYPDDRIAYILSDSGAKYLITTEQFAKEREEFLKSCGVQLCIMEEMLAGNQTDNTRPDITPENLCYCIYTSGSTGKPKGVMIEHHSLVNFVNYNPYNIQSREYCENMTVTLSLSALTFDVSVLDETMPLYHGATVVIATEEEIHNPLLLAQTIQETGVDLLKCTPSYLANLMDIPEIAKVLGHMKSFDIGAEAFPASLYDKLRKAGITAKIHNGYGPTEATITTSMDCMENNRISIGKPLSNTKVYMLDPYQNILPPGVPGELTVLGDCVGRGYVGKEELTKEKFITYLGMPAYRSGDLARWGHDGKLYFMGRIDNQVKLRGLRVELDEISSVMCTYPSVTNAIVLVKGEGDQQFLCGYYVAEKAIVKADLAEYMKKSLAAYMIPTVLMQLDTMPLTSNGKIDKKALPEPERKIEEIVEPQNEIQQKIFDCIAEVIGSREFGITTDIYEAGVTSMGAIRLNVLLAKAFDVVIRNQDLKENNTIEKIEKFIAGAGKAEAYEVYADYPLTQTQSGIFVESVANPGTTIYNIPTLYRLGNGVDINKLKTAVGKTMDAHPYVKTTLFLDDKGEVRAARNDSIEPVVELITCDKLPGNEELVLPYEMLGGRLYRTQIYQTGEGNYLFLDFHHIISDGTSEGIIVGDINRAYEGEELETESYTGFEAALDEQKLRKTDAYDKAKKYFDSVFDGCETDYLPVNDKELSAPSVDDISYESSVSVDEIEKFCADNDLTMNAFFNGVFGYVLSKYNNKEDALYTTVYNGRNDSRLSRAVTMLVKTLPVYCDTAGERKIIDLLTDTRDQLVESMANDIYSFAEIAKDYDIKADILFVYQGDDFGDNIIAGEKAEARELKLDTAKAPINISVFIKNNKLIFHCEYRSDLYQEDTMHDMMQSLSMVSGEFMKKTCLKEISFLNEEIESKLDSFNQTETAYDKSSVVEQFRKQAALHPEHQAVVYLDKSYTYAQVDELSDRIAGYLKAKGIGKEDVVSVLIPRCEYMVIASLGVLKAGAAYQPLDSTYPKERIGFMMQDAAAKHLIAEESLLSLAEDYEGEVLLTKEISSLPACGRIEVTPAPEDLFILLYTSGSTGVPKGVMLEHHNLTAFCSWYNRLYELSTESKVAAYASYGFDADMMDIYPALTSGSCVHIIDESIRLDLMALNDYFEKNGITNSFMTTQVGRQFASEVENHSLMALSVGGEKLVPMEAPENYGFYNGYGPTECTIFTTIQEVDRLYHRVPIGRPLDNVKLYVVDKEGRRLPPGMPGELWVAGHQVGRGYLNQPEQTEEAFIANPFSDEDGYDRVYRTGDIVRFLTDGRVDFIGRNDGQVKIRGFRIELSEVERVIRQYPGIKDATVADFDAAGGGKFLAAYVVSDDVIEVEKLNDFIAEKKPPYMVPEVIMQIDRIPLNQNQKVNKKALPVPERKVEEMLPPQNETQQKIFDCIAEVIGSREFGITTDIFEAGVTSIGAIRLNVLLAKAFEVVIRNQDLKENNTVEKLEKFVAAAGKVETYEVYADYPLTQTQTGIFVECVANAGTTIYNIPYLLKFSDKVDIERLKTAVEKTIDAHPYLKTKLILNEEDEIRAVRNDSEKPEVQIITCNRLPENEELVRPYELMGSRLYQTEIYVTDEGNYLFMDFHHIICDGTSESIILRDINRAYKGETLKTESYTGYEVALDEEKLRKTDAYQKAKRYYDSIFEGVDSNFLPPKDGNASVEASGEAQVVSEISVEAVKQYCQEKDITLNAFFNGVFSVVLSKYNYRDEAVYTTIYNGRNDARLEDTVTMLVKTLPVFCKTEGDLKVEDMLKSMKDQLFNSMANDLYSFGEISRAYDLSADILFAYQGDGFSPDTIAGEKIERYDVMLDTVKAPLSIDVLILDGKIAIHAEYQNNMYANETIVGMLNSMNKVVEEFLHKTYIKEISMMCDTAREQMEGFNDTDYPVTEVPVHTLFEKQVVLHGNDTAVIANGEKLTYNELNDRANKLAKLLLEGGLDVGEAVGVILPRIVDVPVAEYGIMKAGGAFLPMLPDYPEARISYCLQDSGSRFVVTTKAIKEAKENLFAGEKYKVLTVEEWMDGADTENPNLDVPVDSPAYMIYTSGSTGTPKGVVIEHRNLCNFVDANPKNHETVNYISYGKTALSVAAISFDFSLMEIHIPLCNGMTVCMANEEEVYNPLSLLQLMKENHVDVVAGTPSYISNLLDIPKAAEVLNQIRMYDFGAEAFPEKMYEKLHKLSPEAVIVNGYGPTEATISCISKVMDGSGNVTIGKPAANVRAYICDLCGNILPAGARGELVICGSGVGRGYVNLPEKTAEVFVTLEGRKAYRSGDLARYNSAGEIEFFGRLDNQVKLRGLRVELDEISNVMSSYPSVTNAIVLLKGEGQQQFLCGYYVAEKPVDKAALTEHMKKSLAHYMIPSVLIQLDVMPLNANGKINKKALKEPELEQDNRDYKAPQSDLQKKLAEMFASALGMEKVGVTEDFFALGGTSLMATKIAMKAMLENIPIVYADIFDNPTVEKLERFVLSKQTQAVNTSETVEKQETLAEATGVEKALLRNRCCFVDEVKTEKTGDVLLTGATGFLGIHVLKELLESTESIVYCLVRKGKSSNVEARLKSMLVYYFSESMEELFGKRIQVIEGDITDVERVESLEQYDFSIVINCAACVKHFVNDDILDRINVQGVKNLINFCSKTGRRLVQISTVSVAGDNVNDKFPEEKKIHENELFFGQRLENKYIHTKFLAEKAVLEAVAEGTLDGKIIRVGNLMSRYSDGEFQINFVTNGFMRTLKGYAAIGKFPVSGMDESEEFSPIDCTAQSIVKLCGTNSDFTVFHSCNSHRVEMGDVVEIMNHCGLKVEVVTDEEFAKALTEALADETKNMMVSGLVSYLSSDSQNTVKAIDYDNSFTTKILYRLGYKWPITDGKYLENVFTALMTLGFFDED